MSKALTKGLFFLFLILISSSQLLKAQLSPGNILYREIMQNDSLLFEASFNTCQLAVLYELTDSDFEFYHDQSGTTFGQKQFIEDIRKNICSLDYRPQRRLLEGSTNIYPLKNNGALYGAIQEGVHAFYAVEKDKEPYLTSTAKFTHLWIKKDEQWILKRVLSFDHQSPARLPQPKTEKLFESTAHIENWLEENKVPALGFALLKQGKLSKVQVYGQLEEHSPAPYNTIFNVASLTKPVVTMLTLKLIEQDQWQLDEPLYHYWTDPDVKGDPYHKKITTRHILSHQSGFKNWRWENTSNKLTFDFEPGTDYRYSGEGFEYLQKALEAKFKMPLEALADSLIFTPLEMHDTHFYWNESVEEERFAKWHDANGENVYPTEKTTSVSAADNLLTTVEDYGRFAEYVLNGGGISEALYKEMVAPQNGKEQPVKIGLGWEILPNLKNDEYAILHTGGDKGVHTLVMLLPKTGEGMVVFTNGDRGNNLFLKLTEEHLSLGKQIVGTAN